MERVSKKLASQNPNKKSEDYWNEAEARLLEEKCMVKQRELYRLERVQCLREDNSDEKAALIKFAVICHSIGLILTLLIWFAFMSPNAWFKFPQGNNARLKGNNKQVSGTETNQIQKEIVNIKGKITDINVKYRQAMLLDESGKKYLLIFSEDDAIPEKGREFSGQVYLEDFSDSVYTAVVITIF